MGQNLFLKNLKHSLIYVVLFIGLLIIIYAFNPAFHNLLHYTFPFNQPLKVHFGYVNVEKHPFNGERVIVYLVEPERFEKFINSLEILYNNLLKRFPHKLIIFHNGDVRKQDIVAQLMPRLKIDPDPRAAPVPSSTPSSTTRVSCTRTSSDFLTETDANRTTTITRRPPHPADLIEVHEVQWWTDFPPGYQSPPKESVVAPNKYPNYQRMCSFWTRGIFLQPRLANVSYFMRLDTDSYLLSRLEYDPLEFMARHRLRYGFRSKVRESCCIHNLVRWFRTYMYSRDITESQLSHELKWIAKETISPLDLSPVEFEGSPANMPQYFNNFELVHVPSFRDDPRVWDLQDALWRDPLLNMYGMFRFRWGDSALRFLVVNAFPHLYNSSHVFCDLHYFHGARYIANCPFVDGRQKWPPRGPPRIIEYQKLCQRFSHLVRKCMQSIPPYFLLPGNYSFP